MEFKWFMICMAVFAVVMGVGAYQQTKDQNECRKTGIEHNLSAENIKEICK